MSPSEKLGVLAPWHLIIDLSPGWAFVVMLLISPVAIKYIIRPLWEGRILTRRQEFLTFLCDVLFAPTLACALVLVRAMPDRQYLSHTNWLHWLFLLAGLALGVIHFYQERHCYGWHELTSLSKVYHELLFPFVGYLLLTVGLFGLIFAPWSLDMIVMRVVMLVSISLWAMAWPLYDERHKDEVFENGCTRYDYAHVPNSYPWQHRYRYLGESLRCYVDDWRQVPQRLRKALDGLTA